MIKATETTIAVMYGNFLIESGVTFDSLELINAGNRYYQVGEKWDVIGYHFKDIYETGDRSKLITISDQLNKIADWEEEIFTKLYVVSAICADCR